MGDAAEDFGPIGPVPEYVKIDLPPGQEFSKGIHGHIHAEIRGWKTQKGALRIAFEIDQSIQAFRETLFATAYPECSKENICYLSIYSDGQEILCHEDAQDNKNIQDLKLDWLSKSKKCTITLAIPQSQGHDGMLCAFRCEGLVGLLLFCSDVCASFFRGMWET